VAVRAFDVAAWILVFLRMPELTGHSLQDIESRLRTAAFRPKDFWPTSAGASAALPGTQLGGARSPQAV
jgi:hypothetical protein